MRAGEAAATAFSCLGEASHVVCEGTTPLQVWLANPDVAGDEALSRDVATLLGACMLQWITTVIPTDICAVLAGRPGIAAVSSARLAMERRRKERKGPAPLLSEQSLGVFSCDQVRENS